MIFSPDDDISSDRLVLRLMDDAVVAACLAGDLAVAERRLGVAIPAVLLEHPSSLEFARIRLAEDPLYGPWSARAIVLRETGVMVGHVRFHTRPDPEYLRDYAKGAVEFGYRVFPDHRRRGYAREAVVAVMEWARAGFGVRRFVASVSPDNVASTALVTGLGFVKIGAEMDAVDGIENVFLREIGPA